MPNDLLPLYEIAKQYRKSPETIRLWITRGLLIDGQRCKLPARKIGATWSVSEQDLLDFFTKISVVPMPRLALVPELKVG